MISGSVGFVSLFVPRMLRVKVFQLILDFNTCWICLKY